MANHTAVLTALADPTRRAIFERLAAHHETYIHWSMIIVMTRRLARPPATAKPQAT